MKLPLVLVLAALATPALATTAASSPTASGISLSAEGRKATLLDEGETLDATYKPSAAEPLRLMDGINFARSALPPLDHGGAMDSGTRGVLALLLGLIVGFGLGHLVAHDKDGFILFLIVDLAIVVVFNVLEIGLRIGWFWGIGGLALLVSHVFQGIDAYGKASGDHLIQLNREQEVRIAQGGSGSGLFPAVSTTRTFALPFDFL